MLGRGTNVVIDGKFIDRPGGQIDAERAAAIADDGTFDSVRLDVGFTHAVGPEPETTLDPAFVAKLRQTIEGFTSRGITVMINDDSTIGSPARFEAMWRSIGAELADLPPNVFFELANEPLWTHAPGEPPDFSPENVVHPDQWNELAARAIPAIRESNAARTIVVTSGSISFPQAIPQLELPWSDGHPIATFHQYQPLDATGPMFGPPKPWLGDADALAGLRASMDPAVCWSRQHDILLTINNSAPPPTSRLRRGWRGQRRSHDSLRRKACRSPTSR